MTVVIILAAGIGSRIRQSTNKDIPKSLISVSNISMLGRLLDILINVDIDRIYIIVGHLGDQIINFVNRHEKYQSNCVVIKSRNYLKGPIFTFHDLDIDKKMVENYLLCPADLIIQPAAIRKFLEVFRENNPELLIAIDRSKELKGVTAKIKNVNKSYGIVKDYNFTNKKGNDDRKLVPIIIFNNKFLKYVDLAINSGFTKIIDAMRLYLEDGNQTNYIDLTGNYWFDIDDIKILNQARKFFNDREKK
ncbi:MAG: sugar phosphate nucleotidyltransferase [Candidatus Helarchaeota archaeon]